MKNTFAIILLCLFSLTVVAQERPFQSHKTDPDAQNLNDSIYRARDSISVYDLLKAPKTALTPEIMLDSALIPIRDYKIGIRVDSLWQSILLSSNLYPKFRETILEIPYSGVDTLESPIFTDLSTDTLKKRLALLDAKTPFEIKYNPDLEKMIAYFLGRNRDIMENWMAKSYYYFPLFEQMLDKYNLPLELKYLPVIESGLNPRARSSAGATGLWQFMFATGRMEGLVVSSYVDQRMDPLKSTEAACKYLKSMYDIFGDWDLALAAYNAGPGNVAKAIRRSGGEKDYWKLRPYLPRETANYVPAFMAALYLFNYADEHGFETHRPRIVHFQTDTVHVKHLLTFKQIEKVTGIDPDLLSFLNPSYKLKMIPHIKGRDYYLRLPILETGLFVANEGKIYGYAREKLENKTLPRYYEAKDKVYYRVRSGDYLGRIANRFGVSVRKIKRWNHLRGSMIKIGQYLAIYPKKPVPLKESSQPVAPHKSKRPEVYVVKQGDSLWSISRKFKGLTISEIKKWNDIRGNHLTPGMRLKLSKG